MERMIKIKDNFLRKQQEREEQERKEQERKEQERKEQKREDQARKDQARKEQEQTGAAPLPAAASKRHSIPQTTVTPSPIDPKWGPLNRYTAQCSYDHLPAGGVCGRMAVSSHAED